jgi:hypothetical protein
MTGGRRSQSELPDFEARSLLGTWIPQLDPIPQLRVDRPSCRHHRAGLGELLVLGLFTGLAAVVGAVRNFNYIFAGSAGGKPLYIVIPLTRSWPGQ